MIGLKEYLEGMTDDIFEQDEIESHLMATDFDKYAGLLAFDLLSEGLSRSAPERTATQQKESF